MKQVVRLGFPLVVTAMIVVIGCGDSSGGGGDGDGGGNDASVLDSSVASCSVDNGGCDSLATCAIVSGAVTCGACPAGYSGTGATTCTDVDECATGAPCDPLVTCANTAGNFTCGDCPTGYSGGGAAGCVNIDECATGSPCDALTVCSDTAGGFTCGECPSGYSGTGLTGCMDLDECLETTDECVDTNATCSNTVGSYECVCNDEFEGDGRRSGTGCRDVADLLHYRFDGTETTVTNHASNPPVGAETATLRGGVTQGGAGQCGGGLVGDGQLSNTSYLDTGWAPNLVAGTSWTISFYTRDIGPSATLFYIFGDEQSNAFRCFTNGVAGPNNWILRGAGLSDVYLNGGATVEPHLSTFVYDAIANEVRGYLDGVLVTTVAQGGVALQGTGPLKVGGYASNVGLPEDGVMDEFRMYRRALSAEEVLALYTSSSVCSP